jgi:4-azaleucine resistance transporter AzlC
MRPMESGLRASPAEGVVREALVVGAAVGLFGVSFGVLAVASGLSPAIACGLSLLVFAGGSQFAAVGVLASGGSPAAAVASGLLLNARYVAFGLAVAPRLRGRLLRRAAASHLLIDESSALALARDDDAAADRAFWWTGAAVFVLWNAGTAAGALAGAALGDPKALGLDAAFPAGFLALLAPLLRTHRARVTAAVGAMVAVALVPFAPPGVPVLASVGGVLAGLVVRAEPPAQVPGGRQVAG